MVRYRIPVPVPGIYQEIYASHIYLQRNPGLDTRQVSSLPLHQGNIPVISDDDLRRGKPSPMGKPSPAAAPQVLALDPPVIAAIVVVAVSVIFLIMRAMGGSKKKFLNKQVQYVTLGERVNLSHDTVRFRLMLPKSAPVLGLPVGQHFKIMCPNPKGKVAGQWNGREDPEDGEEEIERKYTPTTSDDDIGFADLVIKVYKGGVIDRFPDGGKMSQYFDSLKVGDRVKMSGPWGTHEYMGRGLFKSGRKEHKCTKVGMMAGGTGITPMLQVRGGTRDG